MLTQITLENVWKFYGEVPVLKNVSCSFRKGEIYFVRGGNGSGKTTLLSLLCGYLREQEGSVTYKINQDESGTPPDFRYLIHGVGARGLYSDLSVYENIRIFHVGLSSFPEKKEASYLKEIDKVLEDFNLLEVGEKKVSALSMGYMQRLYLARIFLSRVLSPLPWIVLDEPDVFLDSEGLDYLRVVLGDLHKSGGTCILSSHSENLLTDLPTKTIFMRDGYLEERE